MKKALILILLIFSINVSAQKKYNEGIIYSLEKEKGFSPDTYFYPVHQFMLAHKSLKPWEAFEYCTEEMVYEMDYSVYNFYYEFKKRFSQKELKNHKNIGFSFHSDQEYTKVRLRTNRYSTSFKVKRINGKYRIFGIRSL